MTTLQTMNRQAMKLTVLVFLSIFMMLTSCNGQNALKNSGSHSTITIGDTASALSNSTMIVFQATNGNYWFGSDTHGVYRFDGKTLLHFSTKDGLSSNRTRGIQEDKHGNIYITTLEGINKFDGHTFTALTTVKNMFTSNKWKLQPDDLWFSILGKNGEKGPYRYDGTNLYPLEFPKHPLADAYYEKFPDNAWSPYEVYYIYKDSKGNMWFGTSNFGLCRYDGKSLNWLYEEHLTLTPSGGSFGIRSIIEDKKGKYWFCNTRYRYNISPDSTNENGSSFVKYERQKGIEDIRSADGTDQIYFMSAVEDNNGDLWMVTYNEGVWRYDGKKTIHYPVKEGAKDIKLFSIYKDRKGDLWLGTHESGAYKFNGKTFERFRP